MNVPAVYKGFCLLAGASTRFENCRVLGAQRREPA